MSAQKYRPLMKRERAKSGVRGGDPADGEPIRALEQIQERLTGILEFRPRLARRDPAVRLGVLSGLETPAAIVRALEKRRIDDGACLFIGRHAGGTGGLE